MIEGREEQAGLQRQGNHLAWRFALQGHLPFQTHNTRGRLSRD